MIRPRAVIVELPGVSLEGRLFVPPEAYAAVIVARADRMPAPDEGRKLYEFGLASLSVALLGKEERDQDRAGLDLQLLVERLEGSRRWLLDNGGRMWRKLGLSGHGAAGTAALVAAARHPEHYACVAAKNSSSMLAQDILGAVRCPTLLLVDKRPDADAAQAALGELSCEKELDVHPEPGDEERWLELHLRLRPEHAPWC
jgi:hypothetical protein